MESRYTNRFRSLGERTGTSIKNQDAAGNLTERISTARGSLEAQKQNITELLGTAQEAIASIGHTQSMMGLELVRNIPLPTDDIKSAYGKQMGYVQLVIRFQNAGLLHFMEELVNAQSRISSMEQTIARLAEYDTEMDLVGQISPLDIDSLEERPLSPPDSVRDISESPVSATGKKPTSKTATQKKK